MGKIQSKSKGYLEYMLEQDQEQDRQEVTQNESEIEGRALGKVAVPSIHSSFEKTSESKDFDLEYKDGSVYTGQVVKHGYGVYKDSEGNTYEGNWNLDKKQGYGKQTFKGNGKIEDTMSTGKDNSIESKFGPDFTKVGGTYEGTYEDGKFNGFGKFTYHEGSYYEGTWKQGKIDGIGTFYGSDGSVYTGEWKQNQKNGKGVYKDAQNKVLDGIWENDEFKQNKE